MRRGDFCSINRNHIDLLEGIVALPATKSGTAREVPPTLRAIE